MNQQAKLRFVLQLFHMWERIISLHLQGLLKGLYKSIHRKHLAQCSQIESNQLSTDVPQPRMELQPGKPIVDWKYHKLETYWIHLLDIIAWLDYVGSFPLLLPGWWEEISQLLPSFMNSLWHVASPGQDQNSKLEIQFLQNSYHICTITKLRNHQLHSQAGTFCVCYILTSSW